MITLKYLVLGLTYFGFGLGYLPGLRINRAAVAQLSRQMSAVVLGILDLKTAIRGDRPKYDVFLLAMTIVNIINSTVY